jgi:hypothetical protein
VDVELLVDVAEVVFDRLGAEEQRRGGLAGGLSRGQEQLAAVPRAPRS